MVPVRLRRTSGPIWGYSSPTAVRTARPLPDARVTTGDHSDAAASTRSQAAMTLFLPTIRHRTPSLHAEGVTDQADLAVLSEIGCTTDEIEAIWTFHHRVYMAGAD